MARATPRKDHLINVAFQLFCEHGYHATGVDLIMKESGVSKTTLYKHFTSKEILIESVLELHSDLLLKSVTTAKSDNVKSIAGLIEGMGSHYLDWVESLPGHGCPFLKAAAEYHDPSHPVHEAVYRHFQKIERFLEKQVLQITSNKVSKKKAAKYAKMVLFLLVAAIGSNLLANKKSLKVFLSQVELISL